MEGPEDLEAALLGAPVELDRDEVSALAGVPEVEARAFWVAMGFPEVAPGTRAFTRLDAEALRHALDLRDSGACDEGTLLVLARVMGQGLARLAEAQVQVLRDQAADLTPEQAGAAVAEASAEWLPRLEALVVHVWRRQLAAATGRAFASLQTEGAPELVVGFIDLVGFTRTARSIGPSELEQLLEAFERETSRRVTAHGGRVVKTLGDAVLFVCDDAGSAVEVALLAVEAHADDEAVPEVRAGVAAGPLLQRLGDVFGEPVNLASRLTEEARPGTVLVDARVAEGLADDPAYSLQRLPRRPVRGYRALAPYRVRRHT